MAQRHPFVHPIPSNSTLTRFLSAFRALSASCAWCGGPPILTLGVIDHQALGFRCHGAYGLGAFANGERLRIEDCAPGEEGAVARIGLPSLASFFSPTDATPVFRAIVDAYPNFRTYHTCYAHTLAVMGGLDAALEWGTQLWDVAATQILIEEAGGRYLHVKDTELPGQGTFYSAVFGKPAVVKRLAGIIEHTLNSAG